MITGPALLEKWRCLHVDDTARDIHKIFLSIEERAGNKRKTQERYDNDRSKKFLNLKTLQLLIESFRKMSDEKRIRK